MKRYTPWALMAALGLGTGIYATKWAYFHSVRSVRMEMAPYNTSYDWHQAEKDGAQELTRLIAKFPNAQKFTVTWSWNQSLPRRREGFCWDKSQQTYESVCIGEPCPFPAKWNCVSQQDVMNAASQKKTIPDFLDRAPLGD